MPFFYSSPADNPEQGVDQSLREWYASLLGQSMLPQVRAQLGRTMSDVFGYRGLQFGAVSGGTDLLADSGIYNPLLADESPTPGSHLIATPSQLPVASKRLDLLLLFHTLDFCSEPHAVLREADRVLSDDGHLVIVGFNPRGVWGLYRLLARWHGRTPWNCGFYSLPRIQDWLALLGLKTIHRATVFYRPPLQRARLQQRLRGLDRLGRWLPLMGAVYVIKARKMTLPLTPVRAHWKPRRSLVGSGLIRPASRHRTGV